MDPKEGTTTLEAQTSGADQVVPPAPVDPLQTNFPIAALEKRLDVIRQLKLVFEHRNRIRLEFYLFYRIRLNFYLFYRIRFFFFFF
jgi:hypothetical protein